MKTVSFLKRTPLALLLALLAACGDDDGTGPDRLTEEEVGGTYNVCTLAFDPTGNFPSPVNILTAVEPGSARLEVLSNQRNFSLVFRPTGGTTQTLPGSYDLGTNTVRLNFSSAARSVLLLPRDLTLEFQAAAAKQLSTGANPPGVTVSKATLDALTDEDLTNAADQIDGTLSADFTTGACS